MHIKKLASTLMKKNLIVTITVVTAISLGILTGCGAVNQANADPLTQPTTQIEQTIETENNYQETEASDDITETETQESTQESTQETSEEQAELQNQDADPTEATTQQSGNQNDTQSTSPTTQTQNPSAEQQHTHTWVTETRYRTVHHDAVYENQTIIDQAAYDETVVDQAAWDETTYTTEEQQVWHEGEQIKYIEFSDGTMIPASDSAAWAAYSDAHPDCGYSTTWVTTEGYYTTEYVQVPHVVHHDAVTHVVHHDAVTHVEKVMVKDAYDEQVPYTVTVCSECHQEK